MKLSKCRVGMRVRVNKSCDYKEMHGKITFIRTLKHGLAIAIPKNVKEQSEHKYGWKPEKRDRFHVNEFGWYVMPIDIKYAPKKRFKKKSEPKARR